jgi:sulfate/thiosulfate transport system permease protein
MSESDTTRATPPQPNGVTVSAVPTASASPSASPLPTSDAPSVAVSRRSPTADAPWVRRLLIALAVGLILVIVVLPLVVVFYEALSEGWAAYRAQVADPHTWSAVRLTLLTAAIAVPLNTLFGVAAAWCITKFSFRGKSVLTTLIDLPFAVSPVVAGLTLWLVFGAQGWLGGVLGKTYELTVPLLGTYDVTPRVIFALPGIVLATVFITVPFVARELMPLMQSQGVDEEQAARSLGAGGWQTFWRVTLPNIKWGLLFGVILCNARAMGEFGAVYVVSSRRSEQVTLPLRVERVYYETVTSMVPVFAVASILGLLAVITLLVKVAVEWRYRDELAASGQGRH